MQKIGDYYLWSQDAIKFKELLKNKESSYFLLILIPGENVSIFLSKSLKSGDNSSNIGEYFSKYGNDKLSEHLHLLTISL